MYISCNSCEMICLGGTGDNIEFQESMYMLRCDVKQKPSFPKYELVFIVITPLKVDIYACNTRSWNVCPAHHHTNRDIPSWYLYSTCSYFTISPFHRSFVGQMHMNLRFSPVLTLVPCIRDPAVFFRPLAFTLSLSLSRCRPSFCLFYFLSRALPQELCDVP